MSWFFFKSVWVATAFDSVRLRSFYVCLLFEKNCWFNCHMSWNICFRTMWVCVQLSAREKHKFPNWRIVKCANDSLLKNIIRCLLFLSSPSTNNNNNNTTNEQRGKITQSIDPQNIRRCFFSFLFSLYSWTDLLFFVEIVTIRYLFVFQLLTERLLLKKNFD